MSECLRILSIEDEATVRRSLVAYLEDSGFEMLEAENGKTGLELFHAEKPDLVLCDLRMPEVNGLEVLADVVKSAPETPIIVVSGTGTMNDAIEALRLGAWDYITKPVHDMMVLEHAINKAFERARLIRENRENREHLEETNQRLAESLRQLEQANANLEQRNQELDQFTYIASHDLQEPLRKLIVFSDVLEKDISQNDVDEVKQDLVAITSAAQRMHQLVRDLLSLSRSGRQDMIRNEIALDDCVDLALDALEIRIKESGAVIEREQLPVVRGDAALLTQLFQNLIGNALKFHGDAPPHVTLSATRREDHWQIEVADAGIGLKPEYAEQIFSPFKRLHGRREYEGSGIGLAICRKIVERHQGTIWVNSEPGKGARFQFTIGA